MESENLGYDENEEGLLIHFLEDLGDNWAFAPIDDPEQIGKIISKTRNNIQKYKNYLSIKNRNLNISPRIREKIQERKRLLFIAETVPLFRRYDPTSLTIDNLPPRGERVADAQIVEIIVGNLYVSCSLYNDLIRTPPPERGAKLKTIQKNLLDIVQSYENSLRTSGNGQGKYRKDASGRAMLCYAYETLTHPKDFDYMANDPCYGRLTKIYGKAGFQYNVKKRFILPKRELLAEFNEEYMKKREERMIREGKRFVPSSCWPYGIRQLFISFIPEFKDPFYLT
jgi:hypothetical protein